MLEPQQIPNTTRRWVSLANESESAEVPHAAPVQLETATAPKANALQISTSTQPTKGGHFVEQETWEPASHAALGEAFDLLQAFDGTVETVKGDDVAVILRDLTDPENPDEDAVLSLRQFDDPSRVVAGAPFYLMIGYRERRSGRELVTVARVRTIVPLSALQRARAEKEGRAIFAVIGQRGDE